MDLSNYQLIQSEVKRVRNLSQDDQEDLVQDVCLKLLESNATHITRKYARRLIRNMLIDRKRKDERRPKVIYDTYLAEHLLEKGASNDGTSSNSHDDD